MGDLALGHRFKVAIAKQTAEGTAATTPDFIIPCYGGNVMPVEDRQRHEVADGQAFRPGGFKARGSVEGSPQLACFPDSIGRLLQGHLASDTVSGAADPFSHTIVRADTPPWHTVWIQRPKGDGTVQWDKAIDVTIKTIELAYAAGVPLRCTTGLMGKKMQANVAAPSGGTENKLDNSQSYYTAIGAVLNLDLDATPATTRNRHLQSWTLHLGYDDATLEQTDEFTPSHRDLGLWTVGFSADMLLQNYEAYNATFFGAKAPSAGTEQSQTIIRGSLDLTIGVAPTVNANREIKLTIPAVEFALTPPDIDTSGKGLRATLTAELQAPASGAPFTALLKNALSAAY